MLTILVPMAGSGARFSQAGYSEPKPLIPVNGLTMVERAVAPILEAVTGTPHRLVFVVRDPHATGTQIAVKLWNLWPSCRIVAAPPEGTDGAARTCLLARHLIDNDQPLLVANCDQIVSPESVKALVSTDGDGAILTTKGDGTKKWSYALWGAEGFDHVAEKEPISDRATCGLYWWKRGKDFVTYADLMIEREDRVNGEFYVAPVFNRMAFAHGDIREVRVEDHGGVFHGLGTPEDLKKYLETANCDSVSQ